MVYIRTDDNKRVEFTHYKPFDEKYGLRKTERELLKTGFLVDAVPSQYDGEVPSGKQAVLCYDGDFYWELVDVELDETEQLKAQLAELQEAYDILTGGEAVE